MKVPFRGFRGMVLQGGWGAGDLIAGLGVNETKHNYIYIININPHL